MVAIAYNSCNLCTWEVEAGGSEGQIHLSIWQNLESHISGHVCEELTI